MAKAISVSDAAYEWLLKTAEERVNQNKAISIADVIDKLVKKDG